MEFRHLLTVKAHRGEVRIVGSLREPAVVRRKAAPFFLHCVVGSAHGRKSRGLAGALFFDAGWARVKRAALRPGTVDQNAETLAIPLAGVELRGQCRIVLHAEPAWDP